MNNEEIERRRMLNDELKPVLSAETMTPRMRLGLLMLVLIGEAMMATFLVAAMIWDGGMLAVSPFAAAYLGGLWIALGFFLMLIFGALVSNNPRLDGAMRLIWMASFLFLGPLTLPAYWILHVRTAPWVPWTPPHDAPPKEPLISPRPSSLPRASHAHG